MNSGHADRAINSFINVDIGWSHQFYDGQTKLPVSGQSSSMTELKSSIINPGAKGFYDLAAATKSEREMRRVAVSLITGNVSGARNMPSGHKFSSAFHGRQWAVAAPSRLSCKGGAVNVKNKREKRFQCVPTQVVKTDTSNFMAMVQHFTGIPHTTTTTGESTLAPSAFSSSPRSTTSAISTSLSKRFPHPALCKNSNSTGSKSTTMATTTCASTATFVLPHLTISDPAALHKRPSQDNWL